MVKRQRTPHYITGLGDGHAREKDLRAGRDAVVPTDDIYHVTQHRQRPAAAANNALIINNGNKNNPHNYRLRQQAEAANERLMRMGEMDAPASYSQLQDIFGTGESADGLSNPGLRSPGPWQVSAFALLGIIVLLSALFLHLVADANSHHHGGGHHNHHHHHGRNTSGKHYARIRRDRRRTGSTTTRKKKTDEWSDDEDEEEYVLMLSDGGDTSNDPSETASAAATGANRPVGGPAAGTNVMFYPYQPRHRKASAGGHKETFQGTAALAASQSYSPSGSGFHSRNYCLNQVDGPVMFPAYASPSSSLKVRLANHQPYNTLLQNPSNIGTTTATTGNNNNNQMIGASQSGGTAPSPQQPPRNVVSEHEFIATGLENFRTQAPQEHQLSPHPNTLLETPKQRPKPVAEFVEHDDEDSAAEEGRSTLLLSPKPNPPPHPHGTPLNRQPSYTHIDVSSHSYDHVDSSFVEMSGTSTPSAAASNRKVTQMQSPSITHRRSESLNRNENSMESTLLLSPGTDDFSNLDETPRAGLKRRTVDVFDKTPRATNHSFLPNANAIARQQYKAFAQKKLQQRQQQEQKPHNPFEHLHLPYSKSPSPAARSTIQLHSPLSSSHHHMPSMPSPHQRQQPVQSFPFIPPLDMNADSGTYNPNHDPSEHHDDSNPSASYYQLHHHPLPAPRSMIIEELRLEQLESGMQWQVREDSGAGYNPMMEDHSFPQQGLSTSHMQGSSSHLLQQQLDQHKQQQKQPQQDSDAVYSVDSSSSYSSAQSEGQANDPRKTIKHKRPDLTAATDAASSLQSSIDFSELKLQDVIGGGGFGQVWRATWRGTPVAVKVLTGSAQAKKVNRAVLEEFAAEINLLKGMRHPNICLYMGACVAPPNRAIITELAANGSLWDALRLPLEPPFTVADGISRESWPPILYDPGKIGAPPSSQGSLPLPIPPKGAWPWVLVKRVACGAARGMAYLHSGNPPILHRDLKSANILLNESYIPKVCDFGLSRLKAQERSMTGNCGTVQWMAPEVLANQAYNEKADVFSYGIICWELLTGECPYEGMSPIQCALAVLNRDLRPEIPKWCPPQLRALIKSCTKKDPKERPTFGQIIEAFDAMPL